MKHYSLFLGALIASCFLFSCTPKEEEVAVSSVNISQPAAEMIVGETVRLSATITPRNATDRDIIWASSKQSVATIDKSGLVTAIAEGTSNITASAGGKIGTCVVTVSKKVIAVSSIELNKADLALVEEEEFTLVATVKPDDATDKTVFWSSSDSSVATVAEGKVKAHKEGTAIITAKAGDKTASCSVTVAKKVIAVTSVSLNITTLSLTKGQTETLIASVKPDDATDKTVTWTSSNSNVVSVDNGKVIAMGGGSATVIAKAGEVEATCNVTVTVPVSSVSLDKSTLSLVEGEESTLNVTVNPDDATDKTVIWTSSNSAIATVENGNVKALKEGSATITASVGDKSATCVVSVSKLVIPVASITLNKTSLNLIKGQTETLTATVDPVDATDKTISWSSSEATIASVTQSGVVTALKGGTVIITATAGEKTATCSVIITVPVQSVSLDKSSITLEEGETTTLVATISPNDADDKIINWTSSNTAIATVSDVGLVKAIGEGETTITASVGGKSASCKVTVSKKVIPVTSITLNKTTLSMKKGETATLTATVSPSDATDKNITWTSSDVSIASVTQNGLVTANKSGAATITAKAGDKTASCLVTVTVPVTSISLNETNLSLDKGQSFTLVATVKPDDATDPTVIWSSSDTDIVSVDQAGRVKALSGGEATITAKAESQSAKCVVNVANGTVSVSEILNLSNGATFESDISLVTAVTGLGFIITDGTKAVYVYTPVGSSYYGLVSVGDIVKLSGSKTMYNDVHEVINLTSLSVISRGNAVVYPIPKDITSRIQYYSSSEAEFITFTGTLVMSGNYYNIEIDGVSSSVLQGSIVRPSPELNAASFNGCMIRITGYFNGLSSQSKFLDIVATSIIKLGDSNAVDLGLSVKWASFNVGASSPEEYGSRFAWGETNPKSTFSWENYKWARGYEGTLTKYNNNSSYGVTDGKTTLDLSDDAANAAWGGSWRMPTLAEVEELLNPDNCLWTWTMKNGVYGYLVKSKKAGYTTKSIFIPAEGLKFGDSYYNVQERGYFWTSTLYTDVPNRAYIVFFDSGEIGHLFNGAARAYGLAVRPVTE